MINKKDYLTVPEVAALHGVRRQLVNWWIEQGYLPCKRVGKNTLLVPYQAALHFVRPSQRHALP